jgi:DHA1 family bicyclomycin/chloramphenicol resistance-like MFS transporter
MTDMARLVKAPVPLIIPALLVSASAVSILSTDLYTPSLPHLQNYFATDPATVQLTMSLNLAGYALAQLAYGPLSDRYGRRPVLLVTLFGFALASLACALAFSIEGLIGARTLQGILACAETVVGLAIIRDLYDEADSVQVLAAYGMAIALAPAVGPIIGGQVHVWFGWQANFLLVTALVVLVTALFWRFLPETLDQRDHDAIRPGPLARGYLKLVSDRRFMAYVLISGLTLGGLFAFITEGPFVYINRMGVATEHYGFYYAAMVLTYFLASLAVNRLAKRHSADWLLAVGLAVGVLGGCLALGLVWADLAGPIGLTLAASIFTGGIGFIFATAPVKALALHTTGRGRAAAIFGAVEMGGGALGALAVGLLHDGTAWPLVVVMGAATIMAAAVFWLAAPWRSAGGSHDDVVGDPSDNQLDHQTEQH